MSSTFEKKYSRESTFLTQEIWLLTSLIDLPKRFGKKDFPRPAIFIDCADGLIEIWVNVAYQDWMVANAGRAYGQDLALVQKIIAQYREQLRGLGEIWSKSETTMTGFRDTLQKMRAALANLHTLFYVITCEESLQAVRDVAMEIRAEDRFFVDAEIYVQKTLKKLLPDRADLIWFVTLADLERGIDVNELLKRQQKFLFVDVSPHGPISFEEYCGNKPEISLIDSAKEAAMIRQIKGQIAQSGKVTGKVRIVKKKSQAALVRAGEVIVSPMTTPDFLPAMKLAVAFVTDEGGITCHAAIVARELGKPCIIGTKIATQILKDGDMVEVDADHGTVTKLS